MAKKKQVAPIAPPVKKALPVLSLWERCLIRSQDFPTLDLEPETIRFNKEQLTFPLKWCREFLRKWELTDASKQKKNGVHLGGRGISGKRRLLAEYWDSIFGTPMPQDVPMENLRAKITYRLQFEGYRACGIMPEDKFLLNYLSVVCLDKDGTNPFAKCDETTRWVGTRLAMAEQVNKVKSANRVKSARERSSSEGPPKNMILVLGKYPCTTAIRYMVDRWDLTADQLFTILSGAGHTLSKSTCATQRAHVRRKDARYPVPSMGADDAKAFEKMKKDFLK